MFIQNPVSFYAKSKDQLFSCDQANVCYGVNGAISDAFEGALDDNGLKQGEGVLHRADGAHYTGQFLDGEFHGHGKLVYGETDRLHYYQGEFELSERSGHGILEWSDGRRYEGEWGNNVINGRGTLWYGPKDRFGRKEFQGEFCKDMRHGQGKMTWTDGSSFESEWVTSVRGSLVISLRGLLVIPK